MLGGHALTRDGRIMMGHAPARGPAGDPAQRLRVTAPAGCIVDSELEPGENSESLEYQSGTATVTD